MGIKARVGTLCIAVAAMFSMAFAQQVPVITVQPANATLTRGESYKLFVTAVVEDKGTLTYQWYVSTSANTADGEPILNATDDYYDVSVAGPSIWTLHFYVIVTNTIDDKPASATSEIVAVTANPDITNIADSLVATQPREEAGDNVVLSIPAVPDKNAENVIDHGNGQTPIVQSGVSKKAAAAIAPTKTLTVGFTVGPNPANKRTGWVNFYHNGKSIKSGQLTIYSAEGNIINKIKINDNARNNQSKRQVGAWNLTDSNGRRVSDGTYLVKGAFTMSDGKKENVSVVVGVR
jgi:hypothetical protein